MAEINDPGFLQNGSHSAQMMRLLMESLAPRAGVSDKVGGHLLVTEKSGTPDMSVDVAEGSAYVAGDETADQGVYFCYNDATVNLTIAASDPTNDRIDLVVAQVEDQEQSGSTDDWTLVVVTGTPAGSPTEPSVPSNSLVLARIDVGNGVSSITDADITDRRFQCGFRGDGYKETVLITSSTTFDKANYPWASRFRVTCIGAGGGGGGADTNGGSQASAGGGGGAGSTAISTLLPSELATSETVTVGSGGSGGAASGGTSAGTGGDTSFGSLVIAKGGLGGTCRRGVESGFSEPGDSGNAGDGTGDLLLSGSAGYVGSWEGPNQNDEAAGGNGGDSKIGGGGIGGTTSSLASESGATNALGYGSGGAGSATSTIGSDLTGADGADGVVLVEIFG